jgi:1-deoxy-D-xylulose-5-phosphate synthase
MGFGYLGPIDGHDLPQLIEVLKAIKQLKGPHVLHVVTKKGRGYEPAEADPIKYHGVTRFNPETGEMVKGAGGPPTLTRKFLGEPWSSWLRKTPKLWPSRRPCPKAPGWTFSAKNSPNAFLTWGWENSTPSPLPRGWRAGVEARGGHLFVFHAEGLRPNDSRCVPSKLPVVFCLDRGGLVGDDGPTHHGTFRFVLHAA